MAGMNNKANILKDAVISSSSVRFNGALNRLNAYSYGVKSAVDLDAVIKAYNEVLDNVEWANLKDTKWANELLNTWKIVGKKHPDKQDEILALFDKMEKINPDLADYGKYTRAITGETVNLNNEIKVVAEEKISEPTAVHSSEIKIDAVEEFSENKNAVSNVAVDVPKKVTPEVVEDATKQVVNVAEDVHSKKYKLDEKAIDDFVNNPGIDREIRNYVDELGKAVLYGNTTDDVIIKNLKEFAYDVPRGAEADMYISLCDDLIEKGASADVKNAMARSFGEIVYQDNLTPEMLDRIKTLGVNNPDLFKNINPNEFSPKFGKLVEEIDADVDFNNFKKNVFRVEDLGENEQLFKEAFTTLNSGSKDDVLKYLENNGVNLNSLDPTDRKALEEICMDGCKNSKQVMKKLGKEGCEKFFKALGKKAPVVGAFLCLGSAASFANDGKYEEAAWAAAEAMPVVGDFVGGIKTMYNYITSENLEFGSGAQTGYDANIQNPYTGENNVDGIESLPDYNGELLAGNGRGYAGDPKNWKNSVVKDGDVPHDNGNGNSDGGIEPQEGQSAGQGISAQEGQVVAEEGDLVAKEGDKIATDPTKVAKDTDVGATIFDEPVPENVGETGVQTSEAVEDSSNESTSNSAEGVQGKESANEGHNEP